jgi:tetratricopeptide (TPR) repeat protein
MKVFERLVSVRFDDKHFWFQLALSLMSAGSYKRALFVLKQCITIDPNNPQLYLMAAKICINNLNEIQQAIQFAQQALKLGGTNVVKAYHALGLGYSKLSAQGTLCI